MTVIISIHRQYIHYTTGIYNINTQATEMMAATSHNSTRIAITILDVNDNYPMFRQPQYNISINETDQVDRIILTVIADDADEVCTYMYCMCTYMYL